MAKSLLERRLIDVSDRLKRLRAELAVADEHCAVLDAEADDARLRSIVSETPLAQAEAHEQRRHADAHKPASATRCAVRSTSWNASRMPCSIEWRTSCRRPMPRRLRPERV